MKNILLEEKYILEYVRDMINSFKIKSIEVNNAKYHHNTNYYDTPLILKHGILSLSELNKLGIKKYSSKDLKLMSDTESHINGIDSISLSEVGLNDLYRDEYEYNPFNPHQVDINISSEICARRSTLHYGNEFLCMNKIGIDKLKSIDIRLFKLIEMNGKQCLIKDIIDKYNCLRDIVLSIKESNLDIPLREMSNENLTMDIDKALNAPKLMLIKENK